jgi:hypothetical protein
VTTRRIAGVALLAVGMIAGLCGAGWLVAYYRTQGFFDVTGAEQLAELQSGNLVGAGGSLCLGVVLAVVDEDPAGTLIVCPAENGAYLDPRGVHRRTIPSQARSVVSP